MSGRLILASRSPRRLEILRTVGIEPEVRVSEVDERSLPPAAPAEYATELARRKAAAVAEGMREGLVLGADTVVVLDREILGQPDDRAEALQMLRDLSGRSHEVVTGVCLIDAATGRAECGAETTRVRFKELAEAEIVWYVDSGEPMDKAGAYGIQGRAGIFVAGIEGCYFNVVGLPLHRVCGMLERAGFDPKRPLPARG